jgi:hypothetical protein
MTLRSLGDSSLFPKPELTYVAPKPIPVVPVPKPLPVPPPVVRDEMSSGAGRALRARSEVQLGAAPYSARVTAEVSGGLRMGPGGVLMARAEAGAEGGGTDPNAPVTDAERAEIIEALGGAEGIAISHIGLSGFSLEVVNALSGKEKAVYLTELLKEGEGGQIALLETINTGPEGARAVADIVGEGVRRGEISAEELLSLADSFGDVLGPHYLVQTLALDSRNLEEGGAVELLGKELWDRAGGDVTSQDAFAASLAFTASSGLSERNLTSANDRLLAFDALNLARPTDIPLAPASDDLQDVFETQLHAQTVGLFEAHAPALLELTANSTNESRDYKAMTAFFANEVFNPRAHELVPGLDTRVQAGVDAYTEKTLTQIATGGFDSVVIAQQLGTVLGFIDAGGKQAISDYEADKSGEFDFDSLYKGIAVTVIATGVGAVTAGTGTLASAIIGSVVTNAAGQAIGSPEARKYRDELEQSLGIDDITPGSDSLRELQQAFAQGAGDLSTEQQQNLAIISGAFGDGFDFVENELADG